MKWIKIGFDIFYSYPNKTEIKYIVIYFPYKFQTLALLKYNNTYAQLKLFVSITRFWVFWSVYSKKRLIDVIFHKTRFLSTRKSHYKRSIMSNLLVYIPIKQFLEIKTSNNAVLVIFLLNFQPYLVQISKTIILFWHWKKWKKTWNWIFKLAT